MTIAMESTQPYAVILMRNGCRALVSACDLPLVKSKSWSVYRVIRADGTVNCYLNTKIGRNTIGAHRLVLCLTPNDKIHVDHINGNSLDNRRENLRLASHKANLNNRRPDLKSAHALEPAYEPAEVWEYAPPVRKAKPNTKIPHSVRKTRLSERESQVYTRLQAGMTGTEIARELRLSTSAVHIFKLRAMKKEAPR